MPEDHNLSRVVVSWITLQKFSSPLEGGEKPGYRWRMRFRNSDPVVNPVKGFFYTTPYVPTGDDSRDPGGPSPAFTTSAQLRWTRFVWVDGAWVGFIQVPDDRYAHAMLEHFPYLNVTEWRDLLRGIDGRLVFPITGFLMSLALLAGDGVSDCRVAPKPNRSDCFSRSTRRNTLVLEP